MSFDPELFRDRPELYRQVFYDSTDAIVLTDLEGRIVTANPAWLTLYGYAIEEVRGQTTRLIKSAHTTTEVYAYMWSRISDPDQGFWKGEIVNRKRSGEEVPVLLTITPIRHEAAIIGYMGLAIDVTERHRLDEMRDLYQLVVRHDLKAPLGSIMALLETLAEGYVGSLTSSQQDLLGRARRAAGRMQEIIATSLDLEKLKRGTLRMDATDTNLFDIVRGSIETLAELADRKEVRIQILADGRVAGAEDRLIFRVDPVHLQRCVDNLIKNAIEASPPGLAVTVELVASDEGVRIRVHNGGDPIPPDVRATLFHPFSTFGKRGGTGLGIYGVKMAIDAMGGRVDYETGAQGTTFTIELPRNPAPSPASMA
jgi:PAS domain S-box-containing protein